MSSGRAAGVVVVLGEDGWWGEPGRSREGPDDDEAAFRARGWTYLHLSPGTFEGLPDGVSAASLGVTIDLNGEKLGHFSLAHVREALTGERRSGLPAVMVVHALTGFQPELVSELATAIQVDATVVSIHDYFTLCQNHLLMRNDVRFCHAPAVSSGSCRICVYGAARAGHLSRMAAFFDAVRPIVLAPSQFALSLWLKGGLSHGETAIAPPALLKTATASRPAEPAQSPLRVAYLGRPVFAEGWRAFTELAERHVGDSRYRFYQLGRERDPDVVNVDHVEVDHSSVDGRPLISALADNDIRIAVIWPLWPEPFGFAALASLAAGALVVTRKEAGNVWPAIAAIASEQGIALSTEQELFDLFQDGRDLSRAADRFRGEISTAAPTFSFLAARLSRGARDAAR
jgi:hypothetical protein